MTEQRKSYLGDGVYAHFDGYHIWLTTLEGHEIALEREVMQALKHYEELLLTDLKEQGVHEGPP